MPMPSRKKSSSRIKRASAEERLLDYAKGLKKFRKGRRAVLIRMSALTRLFDERRYRSAAMKNFAPLMQDFEGILLELDNHDILCGLNGATYANMDSIVLKIRIMFRDDENLKKFEDMEDDAFVQWWDIEKDFDSFLEFSKERYNQLRINEAERAAAEDQKKTIGDKIFSLSSGGALSSGKMGGDIEGLKNRFANLGKKDTEKTAGKATGKSTENPAEKPGLAARFSQVNKSSGLESLASRVSNNETEQAPEVLEQEIVVEQDVEAPEEVQAPNKTNRGNKKTSNKAKKEQPKNLATDFSYQNQDPTEDDRPPGIQRNIRYVEIKPPKKEIEIRPVSAMDLEKIETAIMATDLSPMVSREDIRLISGKKKAKTVFSDRSVPIPLVRERFLPLVDISSDRWFMRHLREIVDRRTLIASLDFSDPSAMARGFRVSIDLIDSKEFMTFERNTRKIKRNQLILEFSFQDIVSKVSDYLRVQDILQARGYQICIGDMDPYMFTLLNRSVIRSDFEKVRWTKEFEQEATQEWKDVFKDMVKTVGRERVILVACRDKAAVEAGQALGISLFHGSYVNML